jgi:hypothetical protein
MWQELIAPLIVIEFVSGNGAEERDKTPYQGKFWVYEQAIRVPFYAIYEVKKSLLEVYTLSEGKYQLLAPNERGHYPISSLGVELGLWQGIYKNVELPWLRWWEENGDMLLTGDEQAEVEKQRAEVEKQRAEVEKQRADNLAAKLRELGLDPDNL